MAGASREGRPSEKTFSSIWILMQHLCVCVWHPVTDSAVEYIDDITAKLKTMREQLLQEQRDENTRRFGVGGYTPGNNAGGATGHSEGKPFNER